MWGTNKAPLLTLYQTLTNKTRSLLHTLVPELANKSSRAVDEAVYYQYLQELTACNVEQLVQQPAILRDRQKVLRSEMDDLAFNNYKVFLQSYNTTRKIQKEVIFSWSILRHHTLIYHRSWKTLALT